jgi:hypothetical protein
MYTHKNRQQAKEDRKNQIAGSILGIYMRNNRMRQLPMDEKSFNEIIDYIAPFYITLSQYDFSVCKEAFKKIKKLDLTKEEKKTLNQLYKKIELFNQA